MRNGKPVSVMIRLQVAQELLERAEDAQDSAWLRQARGKPQHFPPVRGVHLAERNAKRRV